MEGEKIAEKDLFEELGLEVTHGEVEVGNTYPIFGMITDVAEEPSGKVVAQINNSIVARMNVSDVGRVEVLRERVYESGIFVSTVTSKEPQVEVECKVVIFGKKAAFNA